MSVDKDKPLSEFARRILHPTPEETEEIESRLPQISAELDRLAQAELRLALGGDAALRLEA